MSDFRPPSAPAVRPDAQPDAWRPIETAPKDGTEIDIWVEWPEYDNGFGLVPAHGSRLPDAKWIDRDWKAGQYSLHQYSAKPRATHWMPAPLPPQTPTTPSVGSVGR